MKKLIAVACVAFAVGMLAGELRHRYDIVLVKPAQAEVGGMGYYELRNDYDFKKAVKWIVIDCMSNGEGFYLSC
tara:strand:+ start:2609 stop:2830 length:222 start_codon:yes stop_codon:yes gene_type:complete